jgi:ABC-type glutathione transport system ATPase component
MRTEQLLVVNGLRKQFRMRRPSASLVALDNVSLRLAADEVLAVVGESGSGKTTLARCITRLETADSGAINLDGVDVLAARGGQLRAVRRRVQLVYQDPYTSLNPGLTVSAAISEAPRVHGLWSRRDLPERVSDLLSQVGLDPALAARRPRQLSGGQRQRVAIARALALEPELLIADEAVSALDVSVQAQIIELLEKLRRERGLGVLFITHQLPVAARIADRVLVMHRGQIVEEGPVRSVFESPSHPYTVGLLESNPSIDAPRRRCRP